MAVWAGALAGAVLGVVTIAGRGSSGPAAPGVVGLHQRVITSFGTMSVDYVVKVVGAPNPMGLSDAPGQLPIQVGVTLTNLAKRPLRYSPRMFEMPKIATGGVDVGRLEGGGRALHQRGLSHAGGRVSVARNTNRSICFS